MASIYRSAEGEQLLRAAHERLLAYWPVPHQAMRLPTCEGETFVIASGDPGSPPVVLLHGAGSNITGWMGDVAALAENFRVYAVDLIGEPGLSAPSRPPLNSDAHAAWLDDVLKGLGVERPALVGLSLGGWMALDYAIRRPGSVAALALLCPAGFGPVKLSFLLRAMWGRLRNGGKVDMRTFDAVGGSSVPRAYVDYLMLIFTHFIPRRSALPVFPDTALRSLKMPVLLIVGAKDALLDSATSRRRLEGAAPHAEIVWLPDEGHFLVRQTSRVLDFLTRTTRS
jgi:pimeloyl-ACP methyl ester carboxylesterase